MTDMTTNTVSSTLMAAMNPKATTQTSATDIQNRFMTLLISQMKNQDPLNPMDNSQVTSQMAQLSTVSGIDKLNTTLQSLMGSYQSSQTLQATAMIGHGVLTPGNSMTLANGSAAFGIDVTTAASNVQVNIQDSTGATIDTLNLGAQSVGTVPLSWDGKTSSGATAPDGQYTFKVSASTNGQSTDGASGLSYGQVSSVSTSSTGVTLNVANVGQVNLANVVQIF